MAAPLPVVAMHVRMGDKKAEFKHGRCRVQTVKKAGPNQGRQFYSCARPEGPRSNPDSNCGFFQWASERASDGKRKRDGSSDD